jgi:hypothetical protein
VIVLVGNAREADGASNSSLLHILTYYKHSFVKHHIFTSLKVSKTVSQRKYKTCDRLNATQLGRNHNEQEKEVRADSAKNLG